jgi:hypothetical protein
MRYIERFYGTIHGSSPLAIAMTEHIYRPKLLPVRQTSLQIIKTPQYFKKIPLRDCGYLGGKMRVFFF